MDCAPVRSIIPSLKLGDYLSVQAHNPCSISHLYLEDSNWIRFQGKELLHFHFAATVNRVQLFKERTSLAATNFLQEYTHFE